MTRGSCSSSSSSSSTQVMSLSSTPLVRSFFVELLAATRGARVGSLQERAQLQLNIEKYVKKKEKEKKLFVSVCLYCCSDDFVIQAQELNSNDVFKCTWMCT